MRIPFSYAVAAIRSKQSLLCYRNQVKAKHIQKRDFSKKAIIILAPGTEEMEFVVAVNVLRRAGVNVTIAGLINDQLTTCSRNIVIKPETTFENAKNGDYDLTILPGGIGGSKAMVNSNSLGKYLRKQETKGALIAAICSAPVVLAEHGVLRGKSLTSNPAVKKYFAGLYKYRDNENVVHDGNLITSRGPATAFEWALTITAVLSGTAKRNAVAKGMLLNAIT